MTKKKEAYKSFLVRLWGNETGQKRRITVVRITEAREQYHFTTLDDLMIFLLQEMEGPPKGGLPMD